jgi:hypothetical protein
MQPRHAALCIESSARDAHPIMDGSLSTPAADKLSSTSGAQREALAEPRRDVGKVSYRASLLIIVGANLMLSPLQARRSILATSTNRF